MAITRAIANGTGAWEGRILAALHELGKRSKLTADGEIDFAWEKVHQRFHYSLVSDCQSARLLAFRQMLSDQATRYRRLSVHYLKEPRDGLGEHREIADAVCLTRKHYMRTVDILRQAAPELYSGDIPQKPSQKELGDFSRL